MSKMLESIYQNLQNLELEADALDARVQRDAESLEKRFATYAARGIDLTSHALSDAESAIRMIADSKDVRALLSLYLASRKIPAMSGIWQRAWQLARAIYGQITLEGDQLSWDSSRASALTLKVGKNPAIRYAGPLQRKEAQAILSILGKGRYFKSFDQLKDGREKGNAILNQIKALQEAANAFNLKTDKDAGKDVSLSPSQRNKAKALADAAALLGMEPVALQRLIEKFPAVK